MEHIHIINDFLILFRASLCPILACLFSVRWILGIFVLWVFASINIVGSLDFALNVDIFLKFLYILTF